MQNEQDIELYRYRNQKQIYASIIKLIQLIQIHFAEIILQQ